MSTPSPHLPTDAEQLALLRQRLATVEAAIEAYVDVAETRRSYHDVLDTLIGREFDYETLLEAWGAEALRLGLYGSRSVASSAAGRVISAALRHGTVQELPGYRYRVHGNHPPASGSGTE